MPYRLSRKPFASGAPLKKLLNGRLAALAIPLLPFLATAPLAQTQGRLPPDFVYLSDVDATVHQDLRYAGPRNFTGKSLPGYAAAECVLRRDVAQALKRVQDDLRGSGLSLKVYDCYRPQRAVNAMANWAGAPENHATKRFYPARDKQKLFAEGWISPRSKHSAGIAIDLTLVPIGSVSPRFDVRGKQIGDCDTAQRAPDNSLDMGTGFDCFSAKSYTKSKTISSEARDNRAQLVAAMSRHGFHNYFREWWHFEFRGGAAAATIYDTPIGPR
jgi:D-alanyl-D-alanine dipeptidase